MAANPIIEQLQNDADLAWHVRWNITLDMNGDGIVTISDAWYWFKWLFFAPGDLLLLLLMKYGTAIAVFLEINLDSLYGVLSGIISAVIWVYTFIFFLVAHPVGRR